MGVFNKIFAALAATGGKPDQLMIDATHLQGAPHSCEPFEKGAVPRRIGRTRGGLNSQLNSKLHAVCEGYGRPLIMLLSEGRMSDFKGAALMITPSPKPKRCLAIRAMMPTGSATR